MANILNIPLLRSAVFYPSESCLPVIRVSQSREKPASRPPDAPKFSGNLEPDELEHHLSQGIPVVVTDINIQGTYGPAYFQQRFGGKPVVLEDCETGKQETSTVFDFFETFGKPWLRDPRKIVKLKVAYVSHCGCLSVSKYGVSGLAASKGFPCRIPHPL